jgi:molybdate transport system regulatory protein
MGQRKLEKGLRKLELQPTFRLFLEDRRKQAMLDQTDALLLRYVSETDSLTKAAEAAGVSYRSAWDRLKKLEQTLGQPVLTTRVGGSKGGEAKLTEAGYSLLKEFRRVRKYLSDALQDQEFWAHVSYKLSARNRIKARIVEIQKGNVTSGIKMHVLVPGILTSIISNEAVDELALKEGDEVDAIIKATEVIIGKRRGT